MATRAQRAVRRTDALSKRRIVEAAIELLDTGGESALTFRALAAHLATGSGAIYHHVDNKDDLLAAATNDVIAHVVTEAAADAGPREAIRTVALGVFDAIDAHPWLGAHLSRTPSLVAMPQLFEGFGGPLQALGVPEQAQFDSASALVSYTLGVAGQNAANAHLFPPGVTDRGPSSARPPHAGSGSTPPGTRSCTRSRPNCPNTTTANSSSPVSTSSWPAPQR